MLIGALAKRAFPFYLEFSGDGVASASCWGGALFAQRNPSQLFVFVGVSLPRLAACAGELTRVPRTATRHTHRLNTCKIFYQCLNIRDPRDWVFLSGTPIKVFVIFI